MSLLSRSPLDVTNAMWNAEVFLGESLPDANVEGSGLADYDPAAFANWRFNTWSVSDASNEIMKGGSDKGFHVEPAAGYTVVMKVNPLPTDIGQVPFSPTGEITLNPGDKLILNKCPGNSCTMQFYYTAAGGTEVTTARSNVEHTVDLISVVKGDSNGSTNGSDPFITPTNGNGTEEEEPEGLTCTDPNSEPNADGTECVCKSGFALDEDEDSDDFGTCIESGMGTAAKLGIALGGIVLLGGGIWYAVKS